MTKFAFLTILFFLSQHLEAQSVDYCDYFFLDVSADEYNGKFVNSYSPEIIHSGQDAFSKFLRSHENRFSYILWNKVDSLEEMSSIYPDTFLLKRKFCNSVFWIFCRPNSPQNDEMGVQTHCILHGRNDESGFQILLC